MLQRRSHIGRLVLLAAICAADGSGCATTKGYERERIVDPAMAFDEDTALRYVRNKIEAAREGALGGFGSAAAGGCGCE